MKTFQDMLDGFPPEVLTKYDFKKALFHNPAVPIENIGCPRHGPFKQYPGQLRRPNGAHCPSCGDEVRRAKQRLSLEEFLERSHAAHNGFYTYDKVILQGTAAKVIVTCPTHGDFEVTPNNHMKNGSGDGRGRGCPQCGAIRRGHRKDPMAAGRLTADAKIAKFSARFVEESRAVHGDIYDYGRVEYRGRNAKVEIVCPHHGVFTQKPWHHLERQHGCPECSHHRSKGEALIFRFVSIFTTPVGRDRTVVAPKELDIWLPEHNLAIEYCGEYWHGSDCEKDEPFARRRHKEKFEACRAAGIRLLTVYESEWLSRSHAVKHLIRNALGRGRGRVGARDCDVRSVGNGEAAAFFERYHVQGGDGFGVHHGLYVRDKLVACMRFTLGANDRGANTNRVWTLSRYATRIAVPGGASRLLAAFVAQEKPAEIKSFSDNRYFDGGMYERLGFTLEAQLEPDYQVYHQRLGLLPKAAWQRREIPKRIRELKSPEVYDPERDPRSERQMTYLLGGLRVFDCGKKRWIWRPPLW